MKKNTITVYLVHAALTIAAVITVLPLVWMVSASLMPGGEAQSYPPRFWPSAPTWQHYVDLFAHLHIARYFLNSLVIATSVTLISVLLNTMAGYALAKFRFRGRVLLFRLALAGLVVPGQVAMLPLFLMLKQIGAINTYWGVILPGMANLLGIFLVRQFALSIPDSLLDAARIDGASEWRIFWSLVLPCMRPVVVTLAVFTFLASWNDFLWPLVVLIDQDKATLPVALATLAGEHVQDTELMMAGSVVTVAPVLLIFLMLQRSYLAGLMAGSVKG